ncbi:MAG: hypothetical protein ACOY99_01220, partial [Pseudomonadota bacterium]
MQVRSFVAMVITPAGCGCATAKTEPVTVDYRFIDRPDESRVELVYRNETGEALCLSNDAWPSKGGKLDQMDDRVFLIIGAERFPIAYFEEYCPSGCVTRVPPGVLLSFFPCYFALTGGSHGTSIEVIGSGQARRGEQAGRASAER